MIGEAMLKGLSAGAWVVGFVTAVGGFTSVMWVVIHVLIWAANGDDEAEEGGDADRGGI